MLSYVARNFIMLNNILTSLLHISRACLVSSKIKERDIVLIYRACFVVHSCSSRVKERDIHVLHI